MSSGEVAFYGAEVQLACMPGADRVLAVGLYVNGPALRGRVLRSRSTSSIPACLPVSAVPPVGLTR